MAADTAPRAARKLNGLQYLRACAALLVMIFHASGSNRFVIGNAGVDIFFVLSGFLMIAITGERSRPLPFLADRLRRIAPPYWIATTLLALGIAAGLFRSGAIEPWHLFASYAFLPATNPAYGEVWPLLVPGWTLNFEMFFYLVFAATLGLRNQAKQVAVIVVLFGALVLAGPLVLPDTVLARFVSDRMLLEFAAGTCLGLAYRRVAVWSPWLGWPGLILAAVLLGIVEWLGLSSPRLLLFGVPAVIAVASVVGIETRRPIVAYRVPLFLGDASYSLYLWHTLAMAGALRVADRLGLSGAAATLFGLAIGIGVGCLAYLAIERPLMRFFRERRLRAGIAIPAGP